VKIIVNGEEKVVSYNDDNDYIDHVRFITIPEESRGGADWVQADDITNLTEQELSDLVQNLKELEDDTRRLIFNRMEQSQLEEFKFSGNENSYKHFSERLFVIESIQEFNAEKHVYNKDGDNYKPKRGPGWRRSLAEEPYPVQKKAGNNTAEMLMDLCAPGRKIEVDCATSVFLSYYWAHFQIHGQNHFLNHYKDQVLHLKSAIKPSDFQEKFGYDYRSKYLVDKVVDADTYIPGDIVYLKNWLYKDVVDNHKGDLPVLKTYLASGEVLIYIGDEGGERIYFGLGLDKMNEDQLRNYFLSRFNTDLQNLFNGQYRVLIWSFKPLRGLQHMVEPLDPNDEGQLKIKIPIALEGRLKIKE
jgi:hypothetical protein